MPTKIIFSFLLLSASLIHAQTPILVGGGYRLPPDLNVAPGQVLTLFATGIGKGLSERAIRTSAPFPTAVAGITVSVLPGSGNEVLSAPILAAATIDTCRSAARPTCMGAKIAALTVQIPFELSTVPDPTAPNLPAQALLRITEDGASSTDLRVNVLESQVHFIQGRHELALDVTDGVSRGASVYHADGSPVAPGLPARVGETVVVYGYGFGKPDQALRTGETFTSASAVSMRGDIHFSTLIGEGVQFPTSINHPLSRYITYFGVVPDTVGVYQMNFIVPPTGQGARPCDASTLSNFTVTYVEYSRTSTFAFCVAP